jgi:hypothetical protein
MRFVLRWAGRAVLVVFLAWLLFGSGSIPLAFGYVLLGWVLFRAYPACRSDVLTVAQLLPGARRRVDLGSSVNSGF